MRPRVAENDLLWNRKYTSGEAEGKGRTGWRPGRGIAQKNGPFECRMAPGEVHFAAIMVFRADPFPFVEACSPVGVRCCAAAEARTFHEFAPA
jgi:hypothetical protein